MEVATARKAAEEANALKEQKWDEAKAHGTAGDRAVDAKLGNLLTDLSSKATITESKSSNTVVESKTSKSSTAKASEE